MCPQPQISDIEIHLTKTCYIQYTICCAIDFQILEFVLQKYKFKKLIVLQLTVKCYKLTVKPKLTYINIMI